MKKLMRFPVAGSNQTVSLLVNIFFEDGNGWFMELPAEPGNCWDWADDPGNGTWVEDTKKELMARCRGRSVMPAKKGDGC